MFLLKALILHALHQTGLSLARVPDNNQFAQLVVSSFTFIIRDFEGKCFEGSDSVLINHLFFI